MILRFTVPGDPVTWKRAQRGKGHSYTELGDAVHREKIRIYARNAGIRRPLKGRIHLGLTFWLSCDPLDVRAGDLDNYEKAVKDALAGIAYLNDRQVCRVWKMKDRFDERPRTEVEIEEAPEIEPTRTG